MKLEKKIVLCIILFLTIIMVRTKVNATEIGISPTNPKVGDKVTVTVKVPNVHTADVTANISGVVSGTIKVVGGDIGGKAKTYSKSATFKCEKEGKINVEVSSNSTAVLSGKYVGVSASKSVTVTNKLNSDSTLRNTTNEVSKPSTDATLKNLGIKPNDFSGFRKATTSYSISVPKSVDKISIYATASSPKATITGTGSKSLQIGKNTFNVKVTAEDKKTTKTYTLTIIRKQEDEPVSDATLTNLGIRPKEYDFTGFKSGTTTYSVSVPNDVEKITIYATAKNSKDTITGSGNKSLKVGQNKCEIKVTSEDKKKTKTYVINVTREEKKEELEEKEDDEKEDEDSEANTLKEGLKDIVINNYTLSPSFSQDVYSYEVDINEVVEKLEIDTETTSDDIEVEIAGNENLKQGENIITLLVYNKKDDTTSTYQITANVGNQETGLITTNKEDNKSSSNAKEWIIKGVMLAIVVLILFILIKRHKANQEYDEEEEEEDDDDGDSEEYGYEDEYEYEDSTENDTYSSNNYNENIGYKSTASEEIRNIGIFDDTQKIEFEEVDKQKRHGKYKGRRFK